MATIRLVPSAYTRSSSSYVVVSDPSNMYTNTDNTTNYASLRGRGGRSSNTTYYAFIHGFNFDDVPSDANVTKFVVKIKCSKNEYQDVGGSYRLRLASTPSSSSVISSTTAQTDISTTPNIITLPTGSRTWAQLVGYGANFSIEVPLRNNSTTSSNYPYVYVYGAEIEVTYTAASNKLFIKQNGIWVESTHVYKKTSGSWVEQNDLTQVFDNGTNYAVE